jgi:signal transduction histidine kinase
MNISRHAHARHASVRLHTDAERLRCDISDDGRGFDPARLASGRYGLLGMRERAKLLGGQLCLETSPGHGAHIEVIVPLAAKP